MSVTAGNAAAQGWIDVSPEQELELRFARSFMLEDGSYELYVWEYEGGGWYFNTEGIQSFAASEHYLCELGQGHFETKSIGTCDVARGSVPSDPVYRLVRGGECHWPDADTWIVRDSLQYIEKAHSWADFFSFPGGPNSGVIAVPDTNEIVAIDQGSLAWYGSSGIQPYRVNDFPFNFRRQYSGNIFTLRPRDKSFFISLSEYPYAHDILYRANPDGTVWDSLTVIDTVRNREIGRGLYGLTAIAFITDGDVERIVLASAAGIMVSDDDGTTWNQAFSENGITALAANSDQTDTIYAGSEDGELYLSTDAGNSWNLYNNTFTSAPIIGLQAMAGSDTVIVAAHDGVYKVYKSVVGVEDWPGVNAVRIEAPSPNPAGEWVKVAYTLPQSTWAKITILDIFGRVIVSTAEQYQTAGRHAHIQDCSALTNGMYTVHIHTTAGSNAHSFVISR